MMTKRLQKIAQLYRVLCLGLVLPPSFVAPGCNRDGTANSKVGASQNGAASSDPVAANSQANSSDTSQAARVESPALTSAQDVLDRMAAAYRNADSYADSGSIHFRMTIAPPKAETIPAPGDSGKPPPATGERLLEDQAPCSVTLVRPNKLRAQVYQANWISDGEQLRGLIDVLPGEVLAASAPQRLTLDEVYSDPVLGRFLMSGIAGPSVQLLLLLDERPLEKMFVDAQQPKLIAPARLEDRLCYRVRAERSDGALVLWIDQQSFALLRIDFPIETLKQQFAAQGEVKSLAVWADYQGARLNGKVDSTAFQAELPPNARLVKQFDARSLNPPPPLPSPLLGKPLPEFALTDLAGKTIAPEDLKGQVAVLDFWFTGCPPCRETLPNLELVYQKYKEHPKVRFLAVSVDPPDVPVDELQKMFTDLKVRVPIVRDPEQKASQALGIEGFPTLLVLGPDGTLQHHEVGIHPELPSSLPAKIEKLLAGESVFEEALREYEQRKADYERSMKEPEVPQAQIAPKTQPQKIKLNPLWTCGELKQPGNILVVTDKDQARLLVLDGWNAVAELTLEGKLAARHELEVGEDDVVAYLRTAVDRQGRRSYLGLANSRPQAFVFDDRWQRVTAYPKDRDHPGIADGLLTDLDGDGELEMQLSYWGVVGVQNVSLDGTRLWSNRSMEHVFRITTTEPDQAGHSSLVCTHAQGTLVMLDHKGTAGKPIAVGNRFLRHISSGDLNGDGQFEYLAIAANNTGGESVVGVALSGSELWKHDIPGGVQQLPLEMIAIGKLMGKESQWIVAGPDGSVHILSADGTLIDQFNYGAALSGLGTVEINGKPALLIATPQGVEALGIEDRDTP